MVDKTFCRWYAGCHRKTREDKQPHEANCCQFHHEVEVAFHEDADNYLTIKGYEFVMAHGYANLWEAVGAANYLRQLQAQVANLPQLQPTDEVTNERR